jgi:hypothetical protein
MEPIGHGVRGGGGGRPMVTDAGMRSSWSSNFVTLQVMGTGEPPYKPGCIVI